MEVNISEKPSHVVKHSPSDNLYENTLLIAKRAKQILSQRRSSFMQELEDLQGEENLVDSDYQATYRERIAKQYEKMPKPVVVAKKDVEKGAIMYSYPE